MVIFSFLRSMAHLLPTLVPVTSTASQSPTGWSWKWKQEWTCGGSIWRYSTYVYEYILMTYRISCLEMTSSIYQFEFPSLIFPLHVQDTCYLNRYCRLHVYRYYIVQRYMYLHRELVCGKHQQSPLILMFFWKYDERCANTDTFIVAQAENFLYRV